MSTKSWKIVHFLFPALRLWQRTAAFLGVGNAQYNLFELTMIDKYSVKIR